MTDNRCNGWANRETWLVNLWFENSLEGMSADQIEETVRNYVEEKIGTNGFLVDMLDIDCINWQELEEHYKED